MVDVVADVMFSPKNLVPKRSVKKAALVAHGGSAEVVNIWPTKSSTAAGSSIDRVPPGGESPADSRRVRAFSLAHRARLDASMLAEETADALVQPGCLLPSR